MKVSKEEKKKLSKKITWISVLSALLLTIAISVSVYIYYQIEPLVAYRLKETIRSSTNGLYTISFSNLSINPFSGNVTINDIVFKPDPLVYERFKKTNIAPSHLYTIQVDVLRLKRVHPMKVYLKRDLVIKSILLERPVIKVYYDVSEQDSVKADSRTTWQRLSKYLHSIKVEEVLLKEIDFKYIDKQIQKTEINGIRNLSITVKDILIDSLSHLDKSRFYHTKDILVEIMDNEFISEDKMYTISFDKLEMSTLNKYAMIKGLHVVPKFSEIPFSLKFNYKKARYQINVNEAWLKGINFKALTETRKLYASSLNFEGGSLDVFMNKQLPKASGDLGENFPQIMLGQFRLVSSIDTLKIKSSALSYSEYDPYTKGTGKISFIGIGGEILNVTNDSSSLIKNNWARGQFIAYPYGKGRIDLNINFNLNSPQHDYDYSGKLHQMQARYFSRITRPLAMLDVTSGVAENVDFNVHANYRQAKGAMTIRYKNLNIGILKLNKNGKLQRSALQSLVANNMLLKESNPSAGEALRTGRIDYYRPDSVSFYSMIWKSLFSGIKENIGMTPARERNLKMQFESFKKDEQAKTKEERKAQRDQRKKRRDTRSRRP